MSPADHHAHQFRNLQKHPKHCPGCSRVWEVESAASHKCVYCKHRLTFESSRHEGETPLYKMFIPIILWVLLGLGILALLGRHYNG